MEMRSVVILFAVLAYQPCSGRSMPEDSVVSVYTTLPTTAGTHPPLDVYHQIANNIAERITSPIYRFLGINKTKSENATRKSWEKIELLDEIPEEATKPSYRPVNNDISQDRDVEELSVESLKKATNGNGKPEKITLFNSYLPLGKLETLDVNDTVNEVDSNKDTDDFGLTLDDVGEEEPRENYFIYLLELLGSIVQLIWGGITAWFTPKGSSSN